ncbi:MAG: SGNH/GDSL hydrolase family protein [Chloroflexi bacterium]|nr:SGNH/GDSL hydrolase family protein [Chloroflexota bacterium]
MNTSNSSHPFDAPRGGRGPAKRDWWPEEFRRLVTLGESTTAGGSATARERAWAPRLAALINDFQSAPVELVNSGIGANLISTRSPAYEWSGKPAGLERVDKHVIAHQPDLLVVSYGLNDCRGGTPLDLFTGELRTLVRRVREALTPTPPLIVLLGPYYVTNFTELSPAFVHGSLELFYRFNEAIASVAQQEDCLYVNVLAAEGETDWLLHDDGSHANDLGHQLIANRIFEVLAQNCSGLARHTKQKENTSPRWRDETVLRADYYTLEEIAAQHERQRQGKPARR